MDKDEPAGSSDRSSLSIWRWVIGCCDGALLPGLGVVPGVGPGVGLGAGRLLLEAPAASPGTGRAGTLGWWLDAVYASAATAMTARALPPAISAIRQRRRLRPRRSARLTSTSTAGCRSAAALCRSSAISPSFSMSAPYWASAALGEKQALVG